MAQKCAIVADARYAHSISVLEYDNSSVGEEEHFETRHFTAVILDWQVDTVSGLYSKTQLRVHTST